METLPEMIVNLLPAYLNLGAATGLLAGFLLLLRPLRPPRQRKEKNPRKTSSRALTGCSRAFHL